MGKYTFLFYHYQTLINWVCNCKNSLKYNISGLKHEHEKDRYIFKKTIISEESVFSLEGVGCQAYYFYVFWQQA